MAQGSAGEVAEFSHLRITGFHSGKWRKHFQPWREALAGLIGAEIDYRLRALPFTPSAGRPELRALSGLQVLEARALSGTEMPALTPDLRRGDWSETPEEPLLVLLLLDLPGGWLRARHAAALAERLEDLLPLIEHLDPSGEHGYDLYGMHEEARRFFTAQAVSGAEVRIDGEYLSRAGDFRLSEVDLQESE